VWCGCVINYYISALGNGNSKDELLKTLTANAHVIGKDILRFMQQSGQQCLCIAGLPTLPQLYCSWSYYSQGKMSKSLVNVIDLTSLIMNTVAKKRSDTILPMKFHPLRMVD